MPPEAGACRQLRLDARRGRTIHSPFERIACTADSYKLCKNPLLSGGSCPTPGQLDGLGNP